MSESLPVLLADIGGTNARFACLDLKGNRWLGEWTGAVAAYPHIYGAIEQARQQLPEGDQSRAACIAIAGPVSGDKVAASNSPWEFSQREMRERFGWRRLTVINDFHAAAYGALNLSVEHYLPIGCPGASDFSSPSAIIGPGTGLGVAGLFPDERGNWSTIAAEGGHARLAPYDDEEFALLQALKRKLGNVQREDVLSGPGLCKLYEAMAEVHGVRVNPAAKPADVTSRALSGEDVWCAKVLTRFCAILGSVAADISLDLGTRGRLFLAGGILPRIQNFLIASPFRQRFEAHSRFSSYLTSIDTLLVTEKRLGLMGAARRLREEMSGEAWDASRET